ncbi:zf-HC2 domain-containing protein, partial [Streptomyces griseus]|uniref:zf-HC2 domain-containing protein n=1 Tax=Streptomyces griseus TaxID=1911 RepID=UPI0033E59912
MCVRSPRRRSKRSCRYEGRRWAPVTSTADTAQHPEVSEISDLTEGLLAPSRATDVRQHLAGCDPCSEVRDSLEEIRSLLGALPEPEPMPEDVAARIDAALAAEARSTAPAEDEPVVVSRETTSAGGAPSAPAGGSSVEDP